MNTKIIEIQRAIVEIENPYPKDDLITCYKDFLKIRDFLPYYKFNFNVFNSFLDITLDVWNSKKRINRISLLESLKRYGYNLVVERKYTYPIYKSGELPIEAKSKLFLLFRKCFEEVSHLSYTQIDEARKIINRLLINSALKPDELYWLCENIEKSNLILNRVLRHPVKSKVISDWAKQNYLQDNYRIRRAELIGWILDETPDFIVDKQTLIEDFEYFNKIDFSAIKVYEDELAANMVIERDLKGILPTIAPTRIERRAGYGSESIISPPILELTTRFYNTHLDYSSGHKTFVPDFEKLREDFYLKIDTTIKVTMLWAIAYSRLNSSEKAILLKSYYCDELNWSFFKICKKLKQVELLKWLIERQK